MGRLSEYINGPSAGRRYAFIDGPAKQYPVERSLVYFEVQGTEKLEAMFDSLMTSDPTMDKLVHRLIAVAMKDARNRVSRDIKAYLRTDPRQAYKAVKHTSYKSSFGGNVSILTKRKHSNTFGTLHRQRKLDLNPHQLGGNRVERVNDERNRLDKYIGSDRSFVLRFINSGTVERESRYGSRGSIGMTNMFGHIAPWHMQQAIDEVSEAVTEYINKM